MSHIYLVLNPPYSGKKIWKAVYLITSKTFVEGLIISQILVTKQIEGKFAQLKAILIDHKIHSNTW